MKVQSMFRSPHRWRFSASVRPGDSPRGRNQVRRSEFHARCRSTIVLATDLGTVSCTPRSRMKAARSKRHRCHEERFPRCLPRHRCPCHRRAIGSRGLRWPLRAAGSDARLVRRTTRATSGTSASHESHDDEEECPTSAAHAVRTEGDSRRSERVVSRRDRLDDPTLLRGRSGRQRQSPAAQCSRRHCGRHVRGLPQDQGMVAARTRFDRAQVLLPVGWRSHARQRAQGWHAARRVHRQYVPPGHFASTKSAATERYGVSDRWRISPDCPLPADAALGRAELARGSPERQSRHADLRSDLVDLESSS